MKKLPGIALLFLLALSAHALAGFIPLGSVTLAIVLGMVLGNAITMPQWTLPGRRLMSGFGLSLAIAMLGAQMQLGVLKTLGISTVLSLAGVVLLAIALGWLSGKILGLNWRMAMLLGVGNGICGSSAIAAAAPLIDASEEQTGVAVSLVNFMGVAGVFLLPLYLHFHGGYTHIQQGLLIGGTLQAVGQVTAAGFTMGEATGEWATLIKMGRILMLGPVLMAFSLLMSRLNQKNSPADSACKDQEHAIPSREQRLPVTERDNDHTDAASSGNTGRSPHQPETRLCTPNVIPWFIAVFLLLAALRTLHWIPSAALPVLKSSGKWLLTMAMASMGMGIGLSGLLKQGGRALAACGLIFTGQLLFILLSVQIF